MAKSVSIIITATTAARGHCWPDLVVYLQVDREIASGRLNRKLDRIEQEDEWFHKRVAEAFDALAAREPERWLVVDGTQPVDLVTAEVWGGIQQRLGLL